MPSNFPNDPYAPNYVLLVNDGIALSDTMMRMVKSVKFEDESNCIGSIVFSLVYQLNVVGGLSNSILYNKLFVPGNKITLRGGYGNELIDIGAGFIREIEPSFNEDSPPELKIICYDRLHNLTLTKSVTGRYWPSSWRDSQIATFIGSEGGFTIEKTNTASLTGIRKTRQRNGEAPRIQKVGESNYDFLKSLADQNGFELSCGYDDKSKKFRLFFEPHRDMSKPIFNFEYGNPSTYQVTIDPNTGNPVGTLISFMPKFSITTQFTKFMAQYTDDNGQPVVATMTLGDFIDTDEHSIKLGGLFTEELLKAKRTKSSASIQKTAYGELVEMVSTKIFPNKRMANEYLKMHMRQLVRDYVTGVAKVKGNQYIRSRQTHYFSGLGPFFDGIYYVKRATHVFSPEGYDVEMEVSKVTEESKIDASSYVDISNLA